MKPNVTQPWMAICLGGGCATGNSVEEATLNAAFLYRRLHDPKCINTLPPIITIKKGSHMPNIDEWKKGDALEKQRTNSHAQYTAREVQRPSFWRSSVERWIAWFGCAFAVCLAVLLANGILHIVRVVAP